MDESERFARDISRGSGTPSASQGSSEKAEGEVSASTLNSESGAIENKRIRRGIFERIKKRALMKVSGELTEEEKAQNKLLAKRKGNRLNYVRRAPVGSELRLAAGGTGQNPLITVGRQAPNPFLINRPFTAQGFRSLPPLRSQNFPIGSRPTNFINSLSGARRPSVFDRYRKSSGRYI